MPNAIAEIRVPLVGPILLIKISNIAPRNNNSSVKTDLRSHQNDFNSIEAEVPSFATHVLPFNRVSNIMDKMQRVAAKSKLTNICPELFLEGIRPRDRILSFSIKYRINHETKNITMMPIKE